MHYKRHAVHKDNFSGVRFLHLCGLFVRISSTSWTTDTWELLDFAYTFITGRSVSLYLDWLVLIVVLSLFALLFRLQFMSIWFLSLRFSLIILNWLKNLIYFNLFIDYQLTWVIKSWRLCCTINILSNQYHNLFPVRLVFITVHVHWYKRRYIVAFDNELAYTQMKMKMRFSLFDILFLSWSYPFCRWHMAFCVTSFFSLLKIDWRDLGCSFATLFRKVSKILL